LNPTVHIVDDDEDFRDGLAWLLDSRGLPARSWSGGEAFLQALRAGRPRESSNQARPSRKSSSSSTMCTVGFKLSGAATG
jgi:hypothetical protein